MYVFARTNGKKKGKEEEDEEEEKEKEKVEKRFIPRTHGHRRHCDCALTTMMIEHAGMSLLLLRVHNWDNLYRARGGPPVCGFFRSNFFFFPRMFAGRYAPVRRLLRIADLWKRGSNAVDFGLFLERLSALIRSDEGIIWFGTWAYCIVSLRVSRSYNYRVICNFSLLLYQRSKSFKSFGKIMNILMRRIHRRWIVNLFGNHFHKYETNSMNSMSWQIM